MEAFAVKRIVLLMLAAVFALESPVLTKPYFGPQVAQVHHHHHHHHHAVYGYGHHRH
jgi:hypothetical protein